MIVVQKRVVMMPGPAGSVTYTPAVPGGWTPVPTTVQGALDELAANLLQPLSRTEPGDFSFVATDIGAVIHATGAGAVVVGLPTLAAALLPGHEAILTVQAEGVATAVTITPDGGSSIDGAAPGAPYVAPVGRSRISLMSDNGTSWFSGTP